MTTEMIVETPTGFHTLGLSSVLLDVLHRANYLQPTPIQTAFIPEALTGRDVIGQAQTGTGKTAAFLLPYFHNWQDEEPGAPEVLILVPTRELVVQVTQEAEKLAPNPRCRVTAIYGGQRFRKQLSDLKQGVSIVVGTPGRILDHLARGTLSLEKLRYVVLDEADRMLDIGFRPDIEKIMRRCPRERQTLLLSATLPPPVLRLAQRYMVDPVHINVSPAQVTVDKIRQSFFTVDEDRKFALLLKVFEREHPRQCIIFCERKVWAEDLYRELRHHVPRVAVIHGDLQQSMRERIMQGFREGKIKYLVATDVVSRGIDVKGISHIINYDLPEDPESYVHRIGRTGRIGADGIAIAFVTAEQGKQLTAIETFINQEIGEDHIEGFRSHRPRKKILEPVAPKPVVPIFGRRVKRYSNRL